MIMFRTLLIAVLSALALSSLTVGSAQAATPLPTATGDKCQTGTGANGVLDGVQCIVGDVVGDPAPTSTPPASGTEADCNARPGDWRWVNGHCVRDNRGNGHGPVFGHPPVFGGGSWNDRLDGRYFRLDRGPALDVCDSGYSSYDLFLSRTLQQATVVRGDEGVDAFRAQGLEAAAGIRQPVTAFVAANPDVRLIDERFMQIRQAVGTAKNKRPETVQFLRDVVEDLKATGFVGDSLRRANQPGAAVAPPG